MSKASSRGPSDSAGSRANNAFSARRWERSVADEFIGWRTSSGATIERMRTFADAIARSVRTGDPESSEFVASKYGESLTSCDSLAFDRRAEAIAYAALHLLDRYGRVTQVLEYLFRIGRLPLRHRGTRALEVGAGPAPALYATRDFYATLLSWPGRGSVSFGPLAAFDTLDRGSAWDSFLHHLSENLLIARDGVSEDGALAFGRSVHDFKGFDVRARHNKSIEAKAARIAREFDDAEESISMQTARQFAYEEGGIEPSAYDLMFLCNFLTQSSMTSEFDRELRRLTQSLTPGGALIVLGGTGRNYPALYLTVREIAASAGLVDQSPLEPVAANVDPHALSVVAEHVRENVRFALAGCGENMRSEVMRKLPADLTDHSIPFRLPKFNALVFVRQGRAR